MVADAEKKGKSPPPGGGKKKKEEGKKKPDKRPPTWCGWYILLSKQRPPDPTFRAPTPPSRRCHASPPARGSSRGPYHADLASTVRAIRVAAAINSFLILQNSKAVGVTFDLSCRCVLTTAAAPVVVMVLPGPEPLSNVHPDMYNKQARGHRWMQYYPPISFCNIQHPKVVVVGGGIAFPCNPSSTSPPSPPPRQYPRVYTLGI